jgi:ABC-2 type transport system permease protein
VVFPATFAATLAADAFAGERERKTIETLFATPLDDRSIFLGKAATGVTFVVAVSAISLMAAVLTSMVVRPGEVMITAAMIAGTLAGAFSVSFLVAAIAIAISVKVHVARAAQQAGSLTTFILAGLTAAILKHMHMLTWADVMGASVATFLIGVAALVTLMMRFQRSDFFGED